MGDRVRRRMRRGAWLMAVLCGVDLFAGSVFMKNGYIIQGPIKEVIEGPGGGQIRAVVVGWANGNVTLHSRFIESIEFEPGEKERLVVRREGEETVGVQPARVVEREVPLPPPLPLDPIELLGRTAPPREGLVAARGTLERATTFGPLELGERLQVFRGLHGSLPQGWRLRAEDKAWVIEGPSDPETGVRPRIVGTIVMRDVGRRAQIAMALEEVKRFLREWVQVEQGYREVGLREGYEIHGRGTFNGVVFNVRQILAWVGKGTWLISCAWTADRDVAAVIEGCLQSFEFETSDSDE